MPQHQTEKFIFTAVVVNDDVTQLNVLSGLLRREGIDAKAFESAEDALSAMDPHRPPDLIVTDLYMPGIDGWRFCRLLRSPEYAAFNPVPILVVSATFAGDETSRITADLGANAFLPSPVDGKRFVEQVRTLMKGDRPRDRLRVLMVEDNRTLVGLLRKTFEVHGYLVDTAFTVKEGMAAIKGSSYDVAVIDYHLPDGEGDTVLVGLRGCQPDCVCIMMTTDPGPELALNWMKRGATAYLHKPFQPEYLMELCARVRRERALLRVQDLLEIRTRQLRKSEAQKRAILDGITTNLAFVNGELEILWVNKTAADSVNKTVDEMIGRKCYELWADPNAPCDDCPTVKAFKTKKTEQIIIHTPDGRVWEEKGEPVFDGKGGLMGVLEIAHDITARTQAEEARQKSEARYRTILESIEDGYFEVDISGHLTFFNDSLCEILGYSKDELMGMNNRQYTDKENAKKLFQAFNKVYATGKPDKGFDWEIIRKDGTNRTIEASVSLRRDAEGEPTGFRGVVRDISEKQRLEAQLQQAQKMEAISILAGGVAHEFNNALMGLMGNIELLKMDLPEDEGRDRYFDAMKGSGHRMSRLTDQLLAYAEGGKYQARDLKLDDFVRETVAILQHDLGPTVRVETHFPKDISYVNADYTQMQMVLSAILANSNEAIENEGLIKISAGNKDLDEGFTNQHLGVKPGPYVCLTIEDNGKGMNEEEKEKIFEPFFTTKFQGRGMGMAAVYGIIKSHDGAITVESGPGKGTVVRIYLPAIEAKEEAEEEVVLSPTVEPAMGEGTILVIEDEEPLVELFRQILEMLGYRVLEARTGREAVEFAKTFDGRIDLALLDIKLPDMSGDQIYPLIMEARPNLKVIVCSGYSIDGPAQEILDAGAEGFVQKPFLISTLAEKLKEVLEGRLTIDAPVK